MASRNAAFHERGVPGALLAPLKWLCVTFAVLTGLLLAAWSIDWIFVFRVWPEGLARLEDILRQDLARSANFGGWANAWPNIAGSSANVLYAMLFKLTGIHDMGMRFARDAPLSMPDTIARNTYLANYDAIQVAMIGTQLFGVRLATMAMSLPILLMVYGVSLADGLAQRAIRRASGGRESASLYHRAKHLQFGLLALFGAAGLLIPVSMDPRWLWAPVALVLAVLSRVQWTYYKKHL